MNRASPDDAALVALAMRGDARATKRVWQRYAPLVAGILRRILGSSPDTVDLEQEVFLVLFQRLETLRRRDALRSFIAGICVRVARNHLRHRRLRSIVGFEPDLDGFPAPSADQHTRDAVQHLGTLLETLTSQDRSLFVNRYVDRMGIGEIACSQRMTFSTTRRRVARMTKRFSARAKKDVVLASYFQGSSFGRAGGEGRLTRRSTRAE
jgi:RNA polymerase sigma-70 factor, ECF subfamily